MKRLLLALAFLAVFVVGYALGNVLPFSLSLFSSKGIVGEETLNVKLAMDNGSPLGRIEVDLGEKVGPPPKGGTQITDEAGIATFKVRPGNYVVYFNENTFPKNLQIPADRQVVVEEGKIGEVLVEVKTK